MEKDWFSAVINMYQAGDLKSWEQGETLGESLSTCMCILLTELSS